MKVHVCSLCGCEYSDETDFIQHSRECDGSFSVLSTSQPPKADTTASAPSKQKPPSKPKPHVCSSCGKGFTRKENLANHRIKFHPEVTVTNELLITNVSSPKWNSDDFDSNGVKLSKEQEDTIVANLLASNPLTSFDQSNFHQEGFANEYYDQPMFTCNVCYRQFTSKFGLSRHSQVHSDIKPYKCKICGSEFMVKVHLDFHSRSHQNKQKASVNFAPSVTNKESFKCPKCDREFQYKRHLAKHLKCHHKRSSSIENDRKYPIKLPRIGNELVSPIYKDERFEITPDQYHPQILDENLFPVSDDAAPSAPDPEAWLSNVVITDVRSLAVEITFLCHQCGDSFLSAEELSEHEKIHIKKKLYSKVELKEEISPIKNIDEFGNPIFKSKANDTQETAEFDFIDCISNENLDGYELERTANEETLNRCSNFVE